VKNNQTNTTAEILLTWYDEFGRSHLPWRQTRDPYAIIVAEFMLQQTQVDRVLPLYLAFLNQFPTIAILADSNLADVMRAWRGLGYNSRAQRLRSLAQTVMNQHAGVIPRDRNALLALPGIGRYTAAAVRAFAFEQDDAAMDTNIQRIVHRLSLGFEYPMQASDRELYSLALASIPSGQGHAWNSAMMDLGATICTARTPKCLICPMRDQCAATPITSAQIALLTKKKKSLQATLPFEQTTRYLRGRIVDHLRDLLPTEHITMNQLCQNLAAVIPLDRLDEIPLVVEALLAENIIENTEKGYALAST